jgi:hypothetical protein
MQKDHREEDYEGNTLLLYWTGTLSAPHPRRSIALTVFPRQGTTAWDAELDVSLAQRTRHPYPINCCRHRPLPGSPRPQVAVLPAAIAYDRLIGMRRTIAHHPFVVIGLLQPTCSAPAVC